MPSRHRREPSPTPNKPLKRKHGATKLPLQLPGEAGGAPTHPSLAGTMGSGLLVASPAAVQRRPRDVSPARQEWSVNVLLLRARGEFPKIAAAPSRAGWQEETWLRCHLAPSAELGAIVHNKPLSGAGAVLRDAAGKGPCGRTLEGIPLPLVVAGICLRRGRCTVGSSPACPCRRAPPLSAFPADGQMSVKARPRAARGQAAGARQQKLS